jgi:ABC-type nitrate/sulfonate/bicarbonate transport system substrate-binding protein
MSQTMRVAFMAAAFLGGLAAAAQADPLKIRIGWIALPGSRAGYLTEKMDLLHHYGKSYTVEALHFSSTPAQLTALAAGELDIAQLAFSSFGAAIENAHMTDVRLIADELEDGVPGHATAHFMVLKDSPIHKIEDLKGKVVATNGIGSGLDIALRHILRQHHLEEKRDYTDVEVNFPNMKSALAEHKIDIMSGVVPFMYDPQLLAIARTLFEQGAEIGVSELLMWSTRAGYIQKNHAALVDLMEDVLRMQRWYFDPANHEEAVTIAAKITKRPAQTLGWVFTNKDFYRNPNGRPDLAAVARNLHMERELGYLKTDIDVAKYADLSIVDAASRRLGVVK